MRRYILFITILVAFILSCAGTLPKNIADSDSYEGILIDSGDSSQIITMNNDIFPVSGKPTAVNGSDWIFDTDIPSDFPYKITQIGLVCTPKVYGQKIQINDVLISGNRVFISYHAAGEMFGGVIQIIRIKGNQLILEQEITFEDADILSLSLDDNTLYFSGLSAGPRQFVGSVDLSDIKASRIAASYVDLNNGKPSGASALNERLDPETDTEDIITLCNIVTTFSELLFPFGGDSGRIIEFSHKYLFVADKTEGVSVYKFTDK